MKGSLAMAAAAALVGGAQAHGHGHNHQFLHKKGAYAPPPASEASCTTKWVVSTGAPTWVPNPPCTSSTTSSSTSVAISMPTAPAYSAPPAPKPTYVAPPPPKQPSQPPSKSPSQPAPPPKQPSQPSYGGGELTGTNDHYGITYTPYNSKTGDCKAAGEVAQDIAGLKADGFQIVRTYSTDCNTLGSVGKAVRDNGMKMIVGVFVKAGGCTYQNPDIKSQVDAISAWKQWDITDLFVVGNEALMNNLCSPSELRDLITVVKSKCPGYHGPYTIAEPLAMWQRQDVPSAICGVIDITGANVHPYFNSAISPAQAGDFVAGQIDILEKICPGKKAINLECGWPTAGHCNGAACPGPQQQSTAIAAIRKAAGHKTVFFSYDNDMWKEPGSCGCEQSWGSKSCFHA